ncbi:MAG: rRNA maturation RNase YbeY [Gammaproteobacteria bacterium HGW-Gammaproteobacteria-4]|nr:MAG: rRNA maturation RNase YbeY [Gammaproteobacteria bacterium HGW-Gammaproteobacteria-5]PKM08425.1 MAG: rRNA maturation RNase YbeY [Gammaproteobacteria bacterium HGW-Gammaproteobacteria-4]
MSRSSLERRKRNRAPLQLELGVSYGISRKGLPAPASFKRWASATLTNRVRQADLAIRIVDEREGKALNHHYRGKNSATNVLSFPAELPEGVKLPVLGDIVLCAPVVAREAKAQGKALIAHYAHLTVHGVLHLLGLDHDDPREAEAMELLERDILAGLGVGDPYL